MAAPGRLDVNICQHPARSPLGQNVRFCQVAGDGTKAGIHSGIHEMGSSSSQCLACFAQRFTHHLHASPARDPAVVRGQVRTDGTHSWVRTGPVRTRGSHARFATPYARTFRANLGGLPVIKSYGFQVEVSTVVSSVLQASGGPHAAVDDHMKTTMLTTQRQPIRSQVFSGSTV